MVFTQKKIRVFAVLSMVEGVIAFVWLMSLPTNRQIYSMSRLAALSVILLIVLVSAAALIYFRTPRKEFLDFAEKTAVFKYRLSLSFLLMAVAATIWVAVLFKSQWLLFIGETTYQRLLPIVIYLVLLLFQAGLFLLLLGPEGSRGQNEIRTIWKPALLIWLVFLAAWLFISITKLGFIHDEVGLSWGPPGTPISFAQVNLVLGISFLLLLIWGTIRSSRDKILLFLLSKKDLIVFLGLWLLAVVLWSNQAMSPTHFAPAPLLPNEEVYPNSDALIFDRSSYHLLNGIGFANQLIRRPLYVGMLALFHEFAGGSYERTIFLQILVLALIPPLVYLLTLELSNRVAGVIAGGLILLRERNSIELSDLIVTSHAKLMMSDMMAMLGVILVVYLTVKLLARGNYSNWAPAIVGACLGLTALVRAQVLILLPVLLLFILFSRKPLKIGFKASLLTLLGVALAMLPWVWRNWNLTGTFVLDDRGEQRLLARNYSLTPLSLPDRLEGETEQEFSARLNTDMISFIRTHPEGVMFFISNHFFRNLAVSSVVVAPAYSTDAPSALVNKLPFWNEWAGTLAAGSLPLFINLAIIAFGAGVAVSKNRLAGLFPLTAFLVYGFGNALVRSSGWRFIQPADWIILVYYSIALAYLPYRIKSFFAETIPVQKNEPRLLSWKTSSSEALILFGLLLLAASVPIAERVNQRSGYDDFAERAQADLLRQNTLSPAEIDTFLQQKNAVLLSGMALYPRYIRPGVRIYLADAPRGYKYLHLWLMNEEDHQIVLPLQTSPTGIPHTAMISVLGCREDKYISASAVIVHQPTKQILIRDPQATLKCPLAAPR